MVLGSWCYKNLVGESKDKVKGPVAVVVMVVVVGTLVVVRPHTPALLTITVVGRYNPKPNTFGCRGDTYKICSQECGSRGIIFWIIVTDN